MRANGFASILARLSASGLPGAVFHDEGGADVLDRLGRREAAGCWKISQTKISQSPPEQERKTQKRLGLTLPFQSPRLDIMPHNGGNVLPLQHVFITEKFCRRVNQGATGAKRRRLDRPGRREAAFCHGNSVTLLRPWRAILGLEGTTLCTFSRTLSTTSHSAF